MKLLGWAVVLASASACNQVFGVERTEIVDAQFFDAPIDAPFECPPVGAPPPAFSRTVNQFVVQDCREYNRSLDGTIGVAICNEPSFSPAELDASGTKFVPIPGFAPAGQVRYDQPRVTPEGDFLFLLKTDYSQVGSRIVRYTRDGSTWSQPVVVGGPIDTFSVLGTPSQGPKHRMVYFDGGGTLVEVEIDAAGVQTPVTQYGPGELGVTNLDQYPPTLSPDGRRLVFMARLVGDMYQRVLYTDRPTITDRFRSAQLLPGVPAVSDAVLMPTCDRVYFSAVQSLFFVQRL